MARITVEDCLKNVNNRFSLIHMASKRVRQLRKGAEPTIVSKNRDIVIALREIAAGNIVKSDEADLDNLLENQEDIAPEETETEGDEQTTEDDNNEGAGNSEGN
ncbi:MAG: DNA-directed RNA polymerase subunit omega [Deltaproteobacteria bacterium]|nr:DNA-directed RNA polymerase subunit omega [Deltaproteobacteria bacterium]